MAKDFNNRLITPELEKAMQDYPLYSQDSKKKDAVCIAVFFIGNARWYILEGQRENDDFVLFGIVAGLAETEYSYLSANDMFVGANFSMLLQDYYARTLTDGVPAIGFTQSCHFLDKVLF